MFVDGYFDFSLSRAGFIQGNIFGAHFKFETDVSPLFPYINAVAKGATYYDNPLYVHFELDGVRCALYTHDAVLAIFHGEDDARLFVNRLISFLNDLYERRSSITPNYKKYKPISVLDLYKILPKTNCGACGFQTCMAFAGALRIRQTTPDKCPDFTSPIMKKAVYPIHDDEGNLASTIEIPMDASRIPSHREEAEGRVDMLPKRVGAAMDDNQSIGETGFPEIQTDLTQREIEVLRLIVDGATNNEISDHLAISPHTVKSHVIHIFNKLGVNHRTQAAVWAARNKIV